MRNSDGKIKNLLFLINFCLIIPIVAIGGAFLFKERFYTYISLVVAVFTCLPMFFAFERKETLSGELMLLSVMVALSVVGRISFVWIQAFKPIAAITIISAIYLGREAGFIIGSMSAVISNFYFGQGPWTPFQMLGWGMIGLLAGCLGKYLAKSKILLILFGALSGIMYSAITDIWSVLWVSGGLDFNHYFAAAITALPTTIIYIVSNVVFMLLFTRPMGDILGRIKLKYGLFGEKIAQ